MLNPKIMSAACLTGLLAALSALSTADSARAEAARAFEVQPETGYQVETLASGLNFPWCVAFLPDNRLLVTQRSGELRLSTQTVW